MESDLELFPGERFSPMDDELLMFYLKPKVNGMQVPGEGDVEGDVICEADLYGDQDPWKIWEKFEKTRANDLRLKKDLYFFTQKKKKGSRASRTVGSGGTWKGQNTGMDVYLLDDQNQQPTSTLLGSKKTYTYKNKGSIHDGNWIMHEFELDESQIDPKKQVSKNDYVLCLLRKKVDPDALLEKKRQEEDQIVEDNGADNTDPASVVEEPEGKRQRLLPCTEYVPTTPSLEDEPQMGMDESMGLLEPPMLDEAELKQLFGDEFLQSIPMEVKDRDAADSDSYNSYNLTLF